MLEAYPHLTNDDIRKALRAKRFSSSKFPGAKPRVGVGRDHLLRISMTIRNSPSDIQFELGLGVAAEPIACACAVTILANDVGPGVALNVGADSACALLGIDAQKLSERPL